MQVRLRRIREMASAGRARDVLHLHVRSPTFIMFHFGVLQVFFSSDMKRSEITWTTTFGPHTTIVLLLPCSDTLLVGT